jgi:hypothetical protein
MLRSCKQHPSAGCCLPFTAYRTSIGGKWTRFSRNNNNTKMHRSNIICPIYDACTAVHCYLDHAGFVFKITIVRKNHRAGQPRPYILVNRISLFVKRSSLNGQGRPALLLSPCFWPFFDCLFIDSFCDLCPTRHHKRGASRDYSQQNSSIALLLSPCLRGTATKLQGVIVGAG